MKRLVVGILAHVDSGKTTLSEALLYSAGEINKLGRVDHKNAFLDTYSLEKERGITIFSKQAVLNYKDVQIALLDTPGHVDFSAEAERAITVLDYAILVISASDGIQSHTRSLLKFLEFYKIPTFLFVNKMDLQKHNKTDVINSINCEIGSGCIDFTNKDASFFENIAMCREDLFDEYLNTKKISDDAIKKAILNRKIFPCFFGSALKLEGVIELLDGIVDYTTQKNYPLDFGARVYKISEDEKGNRLTHLKITGGTLLVKELLNDEKVNEIRIYSGKKYNCVPEVFPGDICAVTGINNSHSGKGYGIESSSSPTLSESIFTYSVKIINNVDIHFVLDALKKLEQEDPELHVDYKEDIQKINIQVMGKIHLEILKRILEDRFSIIVEFEHGSIIYKETIVDTVEGVGHYEPLKHYAEVHLLLEPGEKNSGITIKNKLSDDILSKNYQHQIISHIKEKTHLGVLTGSAIVDIKITLVNGKAHIKHTEGGDFRQATYRAIRQGLMQAKSVLLEPYYSFILELPTENIGRAMTDLQQMGADFNPPHTISDKFSVLCGSAPISAIWDYHAEVNSYTHGNGRLSCSYSGYAPCKNAEEIIAKIGYNPEADLENSPNSVFCSHGSGFTVKWDEVVNYMHLPLIESKEEKEVITPKRRSSKDMIADEEELLHIFEMTYGKIKNRIENSSSIRRTDTNLHSKQKSKPSIYKELPPCLLIDGYNIIYASDELKEIAKDSFDDARVLLINKVCNYQAMKNTDVILVFDAYKVKGNLGEVEKVHGISVVYTKEAETADQYIEKATHKLSKNFRVSVATSDFLEQMIIFGNGALRISAREFLDDLEKAEEDMREFIKQNNKNI